MMDVLSILLIREPIPLIRDAMGVECRGIIRIQDELLGLTCRSYGRCVSLGTLPLPVGQVGEATNRVFRAGETTLLQRP